MDEERRDDIRNTPLNPYNTIPEEPKKKPSGQRGLSIGVGILIGALLSAVIVSLLFLGYIASMRGHRYNNDGQSTNSGSTANADDSALLNSELVDKIQEIEDYIDTYYLYDEDKNAARDGMLSGLVASLDDAYAYYYNEEEYQALVESNSGTYCGIGVQVTQEAATKLITVTKVFPGTPAYEVGIQPGDILVSVGDMDIADMDLSTVVTYIRGEEGTTVDVTFYRSEDEQNHTFTVERRTIDSPSVEYEMLDDNIGYIQLTEFSENTYDQYMAAINDLKDQGVEGLLVDVRNNPGGLLTSVVDILNEMLPEGTIVSVRDKDGNEQVYSSDADQVISVPTVVLVNGNSASAAEIYTAAMQDYDVAEIVGTKTFGKGIVQTIITLSDQKTALKITTARYYTPNGVCIHGEGIEPDDVVELDEGLATKAVISKDEDNQFQEGLRILKEKMD